MGRVVKNACIVKAIILIKGMVVGVIKNAMERAGQETKETKQKSTCVGQH
jgi:hypothetical protein